VLTSAASLMVKTGHDLGHPIDEIRMPRSSHRYGDVA